jgi:hypothetical protein
MKVNVKVFVQDRWAAVRNNTPVIEGYYVTDEPFFLDGPVTRQIAVLDFDPKTGELSPGAKFQPPEGDATTGRYLIKDETDYSARDLNQVCIFGAVNKAMEMFRSPKALGRELTWAFGAPQLLVVPRAGDMANAYYERDSHSLQFFYFDNPKEPGKQVFTSQSRDIVTHETGHAILDGIAPSLYDAITPQSLALHEGVADLVATLAAIDSRTTRVRALAKSGGRIDCTSDFSALAEEFGAALDQTGLQGYLRNMYNQKTLDPHDRTLDEAGNPNLVTRSEPHELCQVLTGALYAVMVKLHADKTEKLAQRKQISEFSASGEALVESAEQFGRMIMRALDYLPAGEISFADYGRAILASDQAAYPDKAHGLARESLVDEFVRRKIVPDRQFLDVKTNWDEPAVKQLNLQDLVESDWVAYRFVNDHRDLLRIPAGVNFEVQPRLITSKIYEHQGTKETVNECLLKVSWTITEPSGLDAKYPRYKRIKVGTTLAIDLITQTIRTLLTSDHAQDPEGDEQCRDRSEFLRQMTSDGLLKPEAECKGPDGKSLLSVIGFQEADDVMKIRGTAKLLHIIRRR